MQGKFNQADFRFVVIRRVLRPDISFKPKNIRKIENADSSRLIFV